MGVTSAAALALAPLWYFSDGQTANRAHDAAVELWESKEPASYSFTWQYCSGMCAPCEVRVTVANGEVTTARGRPPGCVGGHDRGPTIEDVFRMEERHRSEELTDSFDIDYDRVYGFPAMVDIRCPEGWSDCGTGYSVTDFEVGR